MIFVWVIEDVLLVEFMYLFFFFVLACQVRVTVGDSVLYCCVCVTLEVGVIFD